MEFLVPKSELYINTEIFIILKNISELNLYIIQIANLPLFIYSNLVPKSKCIYGKIRKYTKKIKKKVKNFALFYGFKCCLNKI